MFYDDEVTGKGHMVPLVNVVSFIVVFFLLWPLHGDWKVEKYLGVSCAIWGFVSGVAIWFWVRRIEALPPKTITIEATGKQIEVPRTAGSFGHIPVRFYPYVNPVMGLVLAWFAVYHPEFISHTQFIGH